MFHRAVLKLSSLRIAKRNFSHKIIQSLSELNNSNCDSLVFVNDSISKLGDRELHRCIEGCLAKYAEVELKLENRLCCVPFEHESRIKTLIYSPTGKLNKDFAESRTLEEAAYKGVAKALKMGRKNPALLIGPLNSLEQYKNAEILNGISTHSSDWTANQNVVMNCSLGALRASYIPMEALESRRLNREISAANPANNATNENADENEKTDKTEEMGELKTLSVLRNANNEGSESGEHEFEEWIRISGAMHEASRFAKDISGCDPERMCPENAVEFIRKELIDGRDGQKGLKISVELVEDPERTASHPDKEEKYPLSRAVNRACHDHSAHQGRIVRLEYDPQNFGGGPARRTLFLVGKGMTYDTGGADLKTGGLMRGMCRDKAGAAIVCGVAHALRNLAPRNLRVVAFCGFVRNSIGSRSYVADEVLRARCGKTVRIKNTDAEGRLVLADMLHEARLEALQHGDATTHDAVDIVSIATLTGHAALCYGPAYSAMMCNLVARSRGVERGLANAGARFSDPLEISQIRREDFDAHTGKRDPCADILQIGSSGRDRGHQGPAAFLLMASALDKNHLHSETPLSYTHLDIAGSAGGDYPVWPKAATLNALIGHFVLPNL